MNAVEQRAAAPQLSVCVCLRACLPACLPVRLCVYQRASVCLCLHVCLRARLQVCLCACLSIYLCVCLHACDSHMGSPTSRKFARHVLSETPRRKTHLCFEFSPCLSRACLGKTIIFSSNGSELSAPKRRFLTSFSIIARQPPHVDSSSAAVAMAAAAAAPSGLRRIRRPRPVGPVSVAPLMRTGRPTFR